MSNLAYNTQSDLQQIADINERELQDAHPTPFSSNARNRLKESVREYAVQLINESTNIARRHQSESVSVSDVERASQYLRPNTSHKIYRHMGTLGGVLLGTAASNMLSMITTQQYSLTGMIVTFVLSLVSAFMIAVHIVKD
jgi:histone H3/H4